MTEQAHKHLQLDDLPQHARERLEGMKQHHFFTSDLSVNEFLLVKEAGFQPLGLVMATSYGLISGAAFCMASGVRLFARRGHRPAS